MKFLSHTNHISGAQKPHAAGGNGIWHSDTKHSIIAALLTEQSCLEIHSTFVFLQEAIYTNKKLILTQCELHVIFIKIGEQTCQSIYKLHTQYMQLLGKLDFSPPSLQNSFKFDSLETYYQFLNVFSF